MPTINAVPAPYDTGRAKFYPVRLGPLRFTCLVGDVPEPLGDRLEAVGAALTPGERSPRAAQITLPVVGNQAEVDQRAWGFVLRRQVRALMENTAWKQQGLYFEAGWDPETAAWLMVGGGNLTDERRGFAFGDWQLGLEDAYLVGRPPTHHRGRRFTITDRASGTVPTDVRGQLYTTDLAGVAATPPRPYTPGDITLLRGFAGKSKIQEAGPVVDGRTLYSRAYAYGATARDGEVCTYRPDVAVIPGQREREATVEDVGGVRVWALPGDLGASSGVGDRQPDIAYGWEQVMGQLADPTKLLAIENGWVRCTWLGTGGLRVERWSATQDRYVDAMRFGFTASPFDARAVEVTPERAVLEFSTYYGDYSVILQRGWPGPRLEAQQTAGLVQVTAQGTDGARTSLGTFVDKIAGTNLDAVIARCTSTAIWNGGGGGTTIGTWLEPAGVKPVVLQVDVQNDVDDAARATRALALARWDVRSVPVLVGR